MCNFNPGIRRCWAGEGHRATSDRPRVTQFFQVGRVKVANIMGRASWAQIKCFASEHGRQH